VGYRPQPLRSFYYGKKVKVSRNRAEVAQGVPGKLNPNFLDVRHNEGARSSALRTGCLYPRRNPWFSFLEAELTAGHMVLSVAMGKIPSDTSGTARLVGQCLNHYAPPQAPPCVMINPKYPVA
jgi:hypothetical protein